MEQKSHKKEAILPEVELINLRGDIETEAYRLKALIGLCLSSSEIQQLPSDKVDWFTVFSILESGVEKISEKAEAMSEAMRPFCSLESKRKRT